MSAVSAYPCRRTYRSSAARSTFGNAIPPLLAAHILAALGVGTLEAAA